METTVANNSTTQELTIIDRSMDTFREAGSILRNNQTRAGKAVAVGQKILADLKANGNKMTPDLDTRMQKFLANCAQAKTEMNESRKIFTQTMTLITKAFTGEENKIDAATPGTEAFEIQKIRNSYAEQLHREEQDRQRQIKLQQEKDQETINLRAECKKRLAKYVGDAIAAEKLRMTNVFNSITLDSYEAKAAGLKNMQPAYQYSHYTAFQHGLSSRLFSAKEIETILVLVSSEEFTPAADLYREQITELQQQLLDKLPSKRQELEQLRLQAEQREKERLEQQRIAKEQETANAARREQLEAERKASEARQRQIDEENQRLERERKLREEEERLRMQKEEEERQRIAAETIDNNKEMEQTMSLFNQETEIASVTTPGPEVRQGYEIEVLNPAGWMQIFQLWFTDEAKGMDNEKIGKSTMDKMKTYCEKVAHKTGTKIDSKFLRYKETFKAVNRK